MSDLLYIYTIYMSLGFSMIPIHCRFLRLSGTSLRTGSSSWNTAPAVISTTSTGAILRVQLEFMRCLHDHHVVNMRVYYIVFMYENAHNDINMD